MERVPCDPDRECKIREMGAQCFEDVDHIAHPRRDYKTPVEREFRALDAMKQKICRDRHNERHALNEAPAKPPREIMVRAIASRAVAEQVAHAILSAETTAGDQPHVNRETAEETRLTA